ncbi:hypothetical protein [Azohydromonas sediminis]|uniref:hypothetical protein n=1 Tax=Azohydromonas sediminis TaxID=2259674 RepID=UPI000E656459|nr:hypothetical protein [Azohydromonas sediminis]
MTAERIELEMALLLKSRAAAAPAPSGQCLWCGEPLRHPLRWCDVDCRDDWERAHAAVRRS